MIDERWQRVVCGGLFLGALAGCGPATEATTTEGSTTGEDSSGATAPTEASDPTMPTTPTSDTGTDTDPTGAMEDEWVALVGNRDVDLLLVIDNSGSMAEEQARLAASVASLLGGLEASGANYRVGVTTTDSGNPRCPPAQTTPEGGNLVLSSCLDRIEQGEFMVTGEDYSFACTDFCTKRDADLTVRPTSTDIEQEERPRSWVERNEGLSNIGGVESNVEALQCYLPQGLAGCGFESHLESMYLALAKSQDQANKRNYGFLRDTAQLAVVIVSDETDCSYRPDAQEIFIDNKVFWSDPSSPVPTSAVCWRAGVACTGGGPTYSECHAANYDVDGVVDVADDEAVLQPLSKYVDFVKNIEAQKQAIAAEQRVKVSLITGVPVGYESFEAELVYEPASDPVLQDGYGVAPGCVLSGQDFPGTVAFPPVRERELAEAFTIDESHRPLYSLCEEDYSQALATIAEEITRDITPLCFPGCAADLQADTPVVDASCSLVLNNPVLDTEVDVPVCELVNGAWAPPAGQTICHGKRIDRDGVQTPTKLDDMSPGCVDAGFNLEFEVVRTTAKQAGEVLWAKCERSSNAAVDCPLL